MPVDPSPDLPTLENVRALPALDYDEPTLKLVVVADGEGVSGPIEEARPSRMHRGRGARLFVVGVALGAIAVSLVRGGDGNDSLHFVRAWSASTLRSIAHRPTPPAPAATLAPPPPCSLTDEDCAALMAPYLVVDPPPTAAPAAPDIPVVDVNELPMVQEPPTPPPVRVARKAAPHKAKAPAAASASDGDDVLPLDGTPAVLSHPEDSLDPPSRPAPSKPPPLFDAPAGADTSGPVAAASPLKT